MLLSGLLHLFLPGETEKHMSCPRNVRIVGAILLALVLPATVWGFYHEQDGKDSKPAR
jgi:hypothetical protein